jgi:hypothetical protein
LQLAAIATIAVSCYRKKRAGARAPPRSQQEYLPVIASAAPPSNEAVLLSLCYPSRGALAVEARSIPGGRAALDRLGLLRCVPLVLVCCWYFEKWRRFDPRSSPSASAPQSNILRTGARAEKLNVSKASGSDLWTATARKAVLAFSLRAFSPKLWTDPVQYGFEIAFNSKGLALASAREVRNLDRVRERNPLRKGNLLRL